MHLALQRWSRISVLAVLALGGVLAVHFFRTYRPANTLILVPANDFGGSMKAAVKDPALSVIGGSMEGIGAADAQPHNETERMRDSLAKAPVNPHSNEPDTPSFFHNVVAPPLQRRHNERQQAVVDMFKHAWMGYTKYAWGHDELLPISKSGTTSYGMGMTIIDSMDTMWLMGLTEEFHRAREWVASSLNIVGNHREVSVFETNIRVLGGLLAAYHLSNDHIFLQKAVSALGFIVV